LSIDRVHGRKARNPVRALRESAMRAHFDALGGGNGAREKGPEANGAGINGQDADGRHALGTEDRLAILKVQALWTAMVRAGRAERAAELCAADVTVLPPDGAPISGREAARAWLAGLNGGPIERIEVEGVDLRGGPQSAWLTATVVTTRRRPDGARAKERERRLWALVKDRETWKVRLAGWEAGDAPELAVLGADEPPSVEDCPARGAHREEIEPRRPAWRGLLRRPI
jgi:ketosteroid isomerase-like protein